MTAAIIDETLGGLNYVLKREGVVPHGPSFTVHLEVGLGFPRAAILTQDMQSFCSGPHVVLYCLDLAPNNLHPSLMHGHRKWCALHVQVAYKAPVPASTSLICTASLDSLDGRKAWVSAQVLDKPGGTLYATGKALFVIPKVSMSACSIIHLGTVHVQPMS